MLRWPSGPKGQAGPHMGMRTGGSSCFANTCYFLCVCVYVCVCNSHPGGCDMVLICISLVTNGI